MDRTIADFCFRYPNRCTIGPQSSRCFSQEPTADHPGMPRTLLNSAGQAPPGSRQPRLCRNGVRSGAADSTPPERARGTPRRTKRREIDGIERRRLPILHGGLSTASAPIGAKCDRFLDVFASALMWRDKSDGREKQDRGAEAPLGCYIESSR
jgi:hypothetical protein